MIKRLSSDKVRDYLRKIIQNQIGKCNRKKKDFANLDNE